MIVFGWIIFGGMCILMILNLCAVVGGKDLSTRIAQLIAFMVNLSVTTYIWLTLQ